MTLDGKTQQLYPHSWRILSLWESATRHRQDTPPSIQRVTNFRVWLQESIVRVFFMTAVAFGTMNLYGYTTKRSLAGLGWFLFMGLIGVIIASLVIVFVGLTAYDTQRIKERCSVHLSGTVATKSAIHGALRLYLDFINLFIMLIQLLGVTRSE